jgi:RHS repeat-associated core domain
LKQNGALVGSVEYGYDNNGNTKTKTRKDAAGNVVETVTYSWNKENRLVGVSAPNLSVSYAYDADGVRVSSTVNGLTTEYLVDQNLPYAQVLEELVNDSAIASYVYGLDLISQERGNADSYYLVDGLGSTRGLTDASGVVTDTYTYDAFGNLIGVSGATANNYRFAGEQFDPNLGDYYLRQRYYNPGVGRFTRRDTYEGSFEDPITLHKYLYGNANPVSFIDPTGFFSSSAEFSVANNIRDTLTKIYGEVANQTLNIITSGGQFGLEGLASQLAWDLAPAVFDTGKDFIKAFGRSPKTSFERAKIFRQTLNLGEFHPKSSPNLAFADIRLGNKGQEFSGTLLALSGSTKVRTAPGNVIEPMPGLVGNVSGRINFMPQVVGNHLRATDSEIKLLEVVANRYIDNPSIKGKIYLFSERSPCQSCEEVIRKFKKMFPNIEVRVEWQHTLK